jgi:hypothetical protein
LLPYKPHIVKIRPSMKSHIAQFLSLCLKQPLEVHAEAAALVMDDKFAFHGSAPRRNPDCTLSIHWRDMRPSVQPGTVQASMKRLAACTNTHSWSGVGRFVLSNVGS